MSLADVKPLRAVGIIVPESDRTLSSHCTFLLTCFFFPCLSFHFIKQKKRKKMPAVDNYSMITAEDLMNSSALSVSPILISSIFDEINTSPETLNISENTIDTSYLSGQRHHRRSHLAISQTRFAPTPPSTRWRRRTPRVINREDDEENSSDEARFTDYIGPIAPTNYRFPRSSEAANFIYGQNCLNDLAVNTDSLCTGVNNMLDFDVIFDDGGQYG